MADTPTVQIPKKKRKSKSLTKSQIELEAISIVKGEKSRWEVATAFVTDRVSFKMRQLIRILRKNYYGIFDEPLDPDTGLEKIWYPLTEINVEAVVKNVDLDQKDLNFRATNPKGYAYTDVTRSYIKKKLGDMGFGQKLDDFERTLAIDGTAVWKTYEESGKMVVVPVDLLNIYIDPTSPSIQEAYRFTERGLLFPEQIEAMTGWMNTKDLVTSEGLPRTDPYWNNRATQLNSNVKMIDAYEMWGKIPERLITGLVDDTQEIEGHIVVSGIDSPGNERLHLVERNLKKDKQGLTLKPYEEAWYTRVPNRWYGRGIAEKLLTLQIYANIVFNIRINRSRLAQMGLFKVKKGSGVTPGMLSRLQSNGVVVLNNLDDLQQLVIQEAGATSYKDEDTINSISERLTNAFEVVTGEALPSSTPATNATIQNANAKSGFQLIKDSIGFFLQRWMDRHALPILIGEMTMTDLVRISSDEENFEEIVDRALFYYTTAAIDKYAKEGQAPDPVQLVVAMQEARGKLRKRDLFVEMTKQIQTEMLETHFFITNEDMDVSTTLNNIISLIPAAPEYRDSMIQMAFDLMGLGQLKRSVAPGSEGAGAGGAAPTPQLLPGAPGALPGGLPNAPQGMGLPQPPALVGRG